LLKAVTTSNLYDDSFIGFSERDKVKNIAKVPIILQVAAEPYQF